MKKFCGFENTDGITRMIVRFFRRLSNGDSLERILEEAEIQKHKQVI